MHRRAIVQTIIALIALFRLGGAEPSENTPKMECISPDGQLSKILRPHIVDPTSAAAVIDESTVSCPLRAGETTFVIALPKSSAPDRLTFVNENAAASGELKIAVSDLHLPANSPNWTEVDGVVPFSHKRLFNVSIVGVETKFVRLSFHVEATQGDVKKVATVAAIGFRSLTLAKAIDAHFTTLLATQTDLSAVFRSLSLSTFTFASAH
jgi:hypothetical protein